MPHMTKEQYKDMARQRATRCATSIVARGGRMCYGCGKEYVCPLDQMVREKFGPTLLDKIIADPVVQANVTFVYLAPIGQSATIVDPH